MEVEIKQNRKALLIIPHFVAFWAEYTEVCDSRLSAWVFATYRGLKKLCFQLQSDKKSREGGIFVGIFEFLFYDILCNIAQQLIKTKSHTE